MRFTNGYWLMKDGVRPQYPVHAYRTLTGPTSLRIIAPAWRVEQRNNTLDTPVLTVDCFSPAPGVVGVRIAHFTGLRPAHPEFSVDVDTATPVDIKEDDDGISFTSGSLTARFHRGDTWQLDFLADGRTLTSSGRNALAGLNTPDGFYLREQLDLAVGEHVYGLGERFGPLVKNGQVVDTWNADAGTNSDQAYKSIPFYLTDRGYGVFVNHPGKVSFEVASEIVSRVQFSVPGQSLEYFVIDGPTPAEILRRYTALTGRPALPPAWSFGLWLSTSFTTDYDEPTVTALLDGMARRDLPVSVFHFDAFWMREFQWCDFAWHPQTFPDPKGMLTRLHELGLRVSVWISPYIAQLSPLFEEAAAAGYLLKKPNGDVWQWDMWQAGTAIVDFTDPAACAWYGGKLRALLELGVDCFKADFGERIPTDVVYADGSDPERMHNWYAYLYNQVVFETLREHRGDGEAVVFARSATVGAQRFPVHWGGDCQSTFTAMAESLRGGLSLAMSGFGFWSHDIGGFDGTPDPAVFKRWIAFGMLSSHSRLHGSASYRVPWVFDEEAVAVLRIFTRLKARLMPYLFGAAVRAHQDGTPVIRPMVFEFPDDPNCAHLDTQYLLGDSLLVAPVFSADGDTSFYVPAGAWTDLLTGAVVTGPAWVRRRCDFTQVPLLVRPGAVVPIGADEKRFDYPYADDVTLQVYQLADGRRVTVDVPAPDGTTAATFTVVRDGANVTVDRSGAPASWRVLLMGVTALTDVDGGPVEAHDDGVLISLDPDVTRCRCIMSAESGAAQGGETR